MDGMRTMLNTYGQIPLDEIKGAKWVFFFIYNVYWWLIHANKCNKFNAGLNLHIQLKVFF